MKLTILGSGTLVPNPHRHSPAHFLSGDGFDLLLDCGSGTVHGMGALGVDWSGLSHVALTHFHTDHVGDLPALMWALTHGLGAPRVAPLTILGPPGVRAFTSGLANVFGDFILAPGFPVDVVELQRLDRWNDPDGRFEVRTHPTVHTDRSVAYRVAVGEHSVAYTGDTGPDRGLFEFFAGAHVVVAECSTPDPPRVPTHLTPSGIAELGRVAGPGRIVLTHMYPPLLPDDVGDRIREAGYDGPVVCGTDGLTIRVPFAD